jgi:glycosyltransferase involved in cell wall biosynthesis
VAISDVSETAEIWSQLQLDTNEVKITSEVVRYRRERTTFDDSSMRIYTCTPVDFDGGVDFFARDSGLLCRGFQALGIESRAVMPGIRKPSDETDLIRTDFRNLESAEWWSSLNLDGVVLYAWGRPKFRKIAAAIHNAGIFLVLNQDNGGLVSPLAGFHGWLHEQWVLAGQGRSIGDYLRFLKFVTRGLSIGLLVTDPFRAIHLKYGNVIACISPKAAEHYRKLCKIYGGPSLANRVEIIPHAVEQEFQFTGTPKLNQILCVGRWQDVIQKRTWLLIETLSAVLLRNQDVSVIIAGTTSDTLLQWHQALDQEIRERVKIAGKLDRANLSVAMRNSKIFYSPSAFESFGIAAAEALCSGCAEGHLTAILHELEFWHKGKRNPEQISRIWCERLHADKIALKITSLLQHRQ